MDASNSRVHSRTRKFEISGDTSISRDTKTGEPVAKIDLSNSGSLKCMINWYYSKRRDEYNRRVARNRRSISNSRTFATAGKSAKAGLQQ
jgi:hypothetical protein